MARTRERPNEHEAEVDLLKVNELSADHVLHEANSLYDRCPSRPSDDERKVVEALIEKLVIGNGQIDITYSCLPSSEEPSKNQHKLGLGSVGFAAPRSRVPISRTT